MYRPIPSKKRKAVNDMARYIDAEQFRGKHVVVEIDGKLSSVIPYADIVYAPTADVASKSEVARKICCEIEEEIVAALESNYKARTRYYTKQKYEKVDEEFINTVNGKIAALRGIEGFIAELKKKYTEEME